MALDLNRLQASLGRIGVGVSGSAAASAFAAAYAVYAQAAQDAGGNPLVTAFPPLLQARLAKAFGTYTGTAATAAQAFAEGIAAFWAGALFAATPAQPGAPAPGVSIGGSGKMAYALSSTVILVTPTDLQQALEVLFASYAADTATRLNLLGELLHTATKTNVFVLMTGLDVTLPPTGPLPTTQQGNLI